MWKSHILSTSEWLYTYVYIYMCVCIYLIYTLYLAVFSAMFSWIRRANLGSDPGSVPWSSAGDSISPPGAQPEPRWPRCQWVLQLENWNPYWLEPKFREDEFSKWCNYVHAPTGWNFVHQFDVFWYLLIFRSIATFCQGMNSLFFKNWFSQHHLAVCWRQKDLFSASPKAMKMFLQVLTGPEKNKYTWWFQNGKPQSTRNSSHFVSVDNNLLNRRCSALKCSDILTTLGYPRIPVARVWSCFYQSWCPPSYKLVYKPHYCT